MKFPLLFKLKKNSEMTNEKEKGFIPYITVFFKKEKR